MVSLFNRTRKLRALLSIRLGPGAAILPKDIYRISLQFAPKSDGGHMGARKFWRNMLPRLKYHNPSVSMLVTRSLPQSSSATLTLFSHPASPSSPSTPAEQSDANAIVRTIDMHNRTDSDIWTDFVKMTKSQEVQPTEADKLMMQELSEQREESDANSARQGIVNKRIAREAELLKQAKVDATSAA